MIRLNSLSLLLTTVVTACAVEPSGVDALDDLPPYEDTTGAGKLDDANCTDASYREFLAAYLQAPTETAAADNPCTAGNDASFRIWSHLVGEKLTPLRERYRVAIEAATSAAAIQTAGTLTDDERAQLKSLGLVRPASTGLVGMTEWIALHKATLGATMRMVTVEGGAQAAREITAFEDEWLSFVEASRPMLNEGGSWQPWWAANESRYTTIESMSIASPSLPALDASFMARLGKSRPDSKFDADAAAFQTTLMLKVQKAFAAAGLSTPTVTPSGATLALYRSLLAVQPPGGGATAFSAWADLVERCLTSLQLRTALSSTELTLLKILLDARPCANATEPAVAARYTKLHTAALNAGAISLGGGALLWDRVAPTACE